MKERVTTMNLNERLNNREELRKAIIGLVIGDGCLSWKKGRKNAMFQCSHQEKQYDYILWKQNILNKVTSSTINPTKKKIDDKIFNGYHLSTRQHPTFTKLYKRFYHRGNKALDEYIVKKIDDFVLAIIYMDDGTFGKHHTNGKDSFFLCTQSFDYANNCLLKKSLKLNLGLEWNINKANKTKSGTYNYRLRLANRFNEKFLELIKPHIIPSMQYKLGSDANQN